MADTTTDQWIAEEELAKRLGVDREKMRAERRRLGPGEVSEQGKAVVWLRTAAVRVATALGLPDSFLEKTPPPAAPVDVTLQVEELTVVSVPGADGWHFANHNLIRARRASGELVVVRVIDSRKYLPRQRSGQPMLLKAHPSTSGNWWVLKGREPRWTGTW